ncbi:MAG: VIT and VWA domain-containing protein [Methylococcaceae bacterium]
MEQLTDACLQTQNGQPLMLLGVKLTGEIRGLLFEASVKQLFCNPADNNVEVIYTFPLPWGAVLLGIDVLLGEQTLSGVIVEKKQAEASYEEALSERNTAIMLEKNHDQSYSLNLGNLAGKENCIITLHYAQTLQFEQRGLRLLIPTVIAPRYGDAIHGGGLLPHQVSPHSFLADYPFEIELSLYGDLAQARVASPSHPISVVHSQNQAEKRLIVSLAREGALDRDFILVVDQLTHDSQTVVARDFVDSATVAVLASFCPRLQTSGPTMTAVKILVDCSGSMEGDSIDAARRALQAIVKQLADRDKFSLSRFGSTVEHRSRGLWNTTETTKLAAQRWVGALQADLGGTEMEAALCSTFALSQTVSSDVLIVTDGEIYAIDSTIESARNSGHRLFVVGIGSSPAESHLRRLAEATGGACDFVASGEAVEPAVLRMFARLRSPRLSELSLAWPDNSNPLWVSPLSAAVFDGDTINVFARLAQQPKGEVRLLGKRSAEAATEVIGRALFKNTLENTDSVSRMAASVRYQTEAPECQVVVSSEATQLAVAYQLVTDTTNFILIHERSEDEKPADMPELHKVAQMIPAGWGGTGSIRFSIQALDLLESSACLPASMPRLKQPILRESSMAYLDLPVFLRRGESVDLYDAQPAFPEFENDTELTPLDIHEWLLKTPKRRWPKSFLGLVRIGLGAWIVDWLELSLANQDNKLVSESTIVAAFLYVMSQPNLFDSTTEAKGWSQHLKDAILQLQKVNTGKATTGIDVEQVERIMASLAGMTADHWPDQVYALRDLEEIYPVSIE